MARTSSAKGWSPSYTLRVVRKRMISFIALGSYNKGIKQRWMRGGEHCDWADKGMWNNDIFSEEEEEQCLRAARDWEKDHGTSR